MSYPPPGPYPPPGQQPGQPGQYPPPGGYPAGGYPPGAGYPAPGGYPVAQPEKPKRNLKPLFIILGIVLVVCCGGGITAGVVGYKALNNVVAPVRDAAKQYLDALQANDTAGAYAQLCSSAKEQLTEDEFAAEAPKITSYTITGTHISDVNGVKTGSVTFNATLQSGDQVTRSLNLSKHGGDWQVCDS